MTTLAAWVSVDARRPSACYLISDSRISWSGQHQWQYGQKLFVSSKFPDVFGYCGEVQFPTLALRQVLDRADSGLLFTAGTSASERNRRITEELKLASRGYPAHGEHRSSIVHFSRDFEGGKAEFRLWQIQWSKSLEVQSIEQELPAESGLALTAGSGWKTLVDRNEDWKKHQGFTSRGVFSAFCDAISSGDDPQSGGPPQLVGLYPKKNGILFGIVADGRKYLAGAEVPEDANVDAFEWRNSSFERTNPRSLTRLADAQPQPRPRQIK